MKFLLAFSFITLIYLTAKAQDENREFLVNKEIQANDSGHFYFKLRNNNFLHNNEYFGPMLKGQTLLGYWLNPQVSYNPSSCTMLTAGWSFLKYDGENTAYQSEPTFSFQYQMSPHINLILGTLYGTVEHKMIDPIINSERYFTAHNENGIQFLFNFPYFRSDVWINWEAFEHFGSLNQEQMTQGTSSELRITPLDLKHRLALGLQTTLCHHGGQIDSTHLPSQTLDNVALGLKYNYDFSPYFSIGIHHYFCLFTNNTTPLLTPYSKGNGNYTQVWVTSKSFDLMLSHWKGDSFLSGRGDYFYSSMSYTVPVYLQKITELAAARIVYRKSVTKEVTLGARFEGFYYFEQSLFDYSYSLYIVFNLDRQIFKKL